MVSNDDIDKSKDYCELNQFLRKEGWIKHISGYCPSELSCLTVPPKQDKVLKSLVQHVITLMSNIQDAIGMAGYYVQQLLGKQPR